MSNRVIGKLITDTTLTFYVSNGQPHTVARESGAFDAIVAELNKLNPDADKLIALADSVKTVQTQLRQAVSNSADANYLTKGVINVTRSGVTFNGETIHTSLADRLMSVLNAGLRLGPWIRFAENVYQNPAEYAREELYDWLERSDLPITDDGHFIAYKVVKDDFTDVYTGSFDNSPGQVVQLAGRHEVDATRSRHCSTGLHFCSKAYLPNFGYDSSGRRVVLVKVNPADVVSIPDDYDFSKGRTWRYEVLEEIAHEEINNRSWGPVYWPNDDADNESDDHYEEDYLDEEDEVEDREAFVAARAAELVEYSGIVELRRLASASGLNSTLAWKVYSKSQLAKYVAEVEADAR